MYIDPMTPDPREIKLPVWAQDTINGLRRQVSDAQSEAQVARHEAGPADTDTHLQRGLRNEDIPLPTGSQIRFTLGAGFEQYIEARVSTEWVNREQRSVLFLRGGTTLHLLPRSSNGLNAIVER